jgi:hypothetical protein
MPSRSTGVKTRREGGEWVKKKATKKKKTK